MTKVSAKSPFCVNFSTGEIEECYEKFTKKNINKREKRRSSSLIVLILQHPQRPIRRFHKKSLLTKPEASQ